MTYIGVAIAVGGVAVATIYALCAAAAAGDMALALRCGRATPPAPTADAVARMADARDRVLALAADMLAADLVAVAQDDGVWCWDALRREARRHPPGTDPALLVHSVRAAISAPVGDGRLTALTTQPERSFSARELALLGTLADACTAALRLTPPDLAGVAAKVDGLATALGDLSRSELRWRGGDFVALVAAVARRLELTETEQAETELAARLLDVGMLRVPVAVADRRGPLSAAEQRVVRRHPAWGAEALLTVPGLAPVALLVLCHHERWDGTGYPHGLGGERIPLGARVLAGCDAWWAMTSERAFASACGADEAVAELVGAWGAQLDVRVVEALLAEVAGVTLVA